MPSSNTLIYGLSIITAALLGYASMYAANNIFPITGGSAPEPESKPEPAPEPKPEPKPAPAPAPAPAPEPKPEPETEGGGLLEEYTESESEEELVETPQQSGGFAYKEPLTNGLTYQF